MKKDRCFRTGADHDYQIVVAVNLVYHALSELVGLYVEEV